MNRNSYNHSIILIRLNIRVLIRRSAYILSLSLSLVRETDDYWFSYFTFGIVVSPRVSVRVVKTINYKLTSLHRSTIIKYVRMNFLDHIPPIRFHSILCNVIINVESKILMLQYIYISMCILRRWFWFFSAKEIRSFFCCYKE